MIYQIYPRSFADANGDGVGDLAGIEAHVDYVAGLGVDAIWLSPIFPSTMADFAYDVADYTGVSTAIQVELQNALLGKKSPQQALDDAVAAAADQG